MYNKISKEMEHLIYNISYPEYLIPRRDMLAKLNYEFGSHNCVVISGIGGSGKTSLAYLYAKEQNFNNVAWVTVNGIIEDVFVDKIAGLLFNKEEYESFTKINDKQKQLTIIKSELSKIQGKNLLVFDINTNNEEIKQEIETQIHNYQPANNWKTLVLTRVFAKDNTRVFAEKPTYYATIKMDKMTEDDAQKLFIKNWTRTKIEFSQDQLDEITKELYYHPLLIEQTAIVFSKGHEKTSDEIITKIKENSKINNPRTKKYLRGLAIEGKEQQDIYTYLINLCNIERLSADEVKFLAVYVTWPEEPISVEVIETLLPHSEEISYSLIEKGILYYNDYKFTIHRLMADVIREQISIKEFDYSKYLETIQKILDDDVRKVSLHKYTKYIASSFINYGICNNANLFTSFLYVLSNDKNDPSEQEFPNIENKLGKNAEPFQAARFYNAVARAEAFKNNLSDAKLHVEKALGIMEGVEENDETLQLKGALLQNLAILEKNFGDTDSAKKHNKESLETGRKLPKTPYYLENMATTLSNLAILEKDLGDTDSAKKHYEESLEIKRRLPETPQYLYSLATTLDNFAILEENLGDTDSAKKYYEESLEITKKLPETPQYLDRLATTLHNLAMLEEKLGNTDSAKNHYEESLEILRQLPETPEYLNNLTYSLAGLAILEENRGNTNYALMHYEECLEISRRIGNEEAMKFFKGKLLIL